MAASFAAFFAAFLLFLSSLAGFDIPSTALSVLVSGLLSRSALRSRLSFFSFLLPFFAISAPSRRFGL
ncbi:MAG TPA: hypothetical protein VN461_10640 [Vicinamibacteria bacterium]|nr:hypothetical protein [Vicinamibacteria bacterium]